MMILRLPCCSSEDLQYLPVGRLFHWSISLILRLVNYKRKKNQRCRDVLLIYNIRVESKSSSSSSSSDLIQSRCGI
ncbi:hypothetical protein Hdeb2414_s0001g00007281 [Helianthus debilis subsp. tardiflorus]